MKPDLVILACGGTGRELAELAEERFNVLGFLDDARTGSRILGGITEWSRFVPGASLASGLGSYRSMGRRRQILEALPLEAFATIVADDARVYPSAKLGRALSVFPFSVVATDAVLGDHCLVYHRCVVSHDAVVGDLSILSNAVTLSGGVRIGRNTYVGAGATVLEGVTIGDDCIVAAGATVIADVPDGTIYLGPKKVKENRFR